MSLPAVIAVDPESLVAYASSDLELVELWIGRHESPHTRRNYRRQASRFLTFVAKPLPTVRLQEVQAYAASLSNLSPASRANAIATVKSLIAFGQGIGYLRFNVGAAVKAPAVRGALAERIVAEADAMRLIARETNPRNLAILTLMYGAGLRISEAANLRWRDCAARDAAGQVTVLGKGGKTRVVLVSANTWRALEAIRPAGALPDAAVFCSRKGGGRLDPSALHRIVKAAAERAGLPSLVSAHWLRHAHASHALDRGAPIHLVQATLGHASVSTTGRYTHARPSESSSRFLGV